MSPTPPADPATDEQLMRRYADGDASAFAALYARHKDPLYRYLLRGSRRPALADELAQEVWQRVIEARRRWEPAARFTTWLYRIARHRLIDHLRALRPAQAVVADGDEAYDAALATALDDLDDPARRAEGEDCLRRFGLALAALPAAQRELVVLRANGDGRGGDASLEALAAIQDAPRETVKSRLRYAYTRLKEVLGDCFER